MQDAQKGTAMFYDLLGACEDRAKASSCGGSVSIVCAQDSTGAFKWRVSNSSTCCLVDAAR